MSARGIEETAERAGHIDLSDAKSGLTTVSLQELCDPAADMLHQHLTIETPLESLGDLWPVFRGVAHRIDVGGTLTVHNAGPAIRVRPTSRLRAADINNVLRLAGFEPVRLKRTRAFNEVTARRTQRHAESYSCTVVVPCRNEVDNIDALVRRLPALGTHTELIFVDGNSSDGTSERIEEIIRDNPERDIKLLRQKRPAGKAGAVFDGFDLATGDVLIILDADMTVAPEDLPRFYLALAEGRARFANGTRFMYPMETGAMPGLNNLGNRAFGRFFSWVLGSRVTDTLCGTKALFRSDWASISEARPLFGGHDPWGDFDLLLGARYLGLDLIEVAVPYGARVAGESKMRPLQHGMTLARTCAAGARRLKLGHPGPGAT